MADVSFSVKKKGFKSLSNKITYREQKLLSSKKYIFEDPLKRTLFNIRKRLQKDTQHGGINHVYTGKMLNSVSSKSDSPTPDTMQIHFGLFVPYGQVFELGGKPRFVPYNTLARWAVHRFGSDKPTKAIQRSIQSKGTRGYGIVMRTWEGNKKHYLDLVYSRFWKVWS